MSHHRDDEDLGHRLIISFLVAADKQLTGKVLPGSRWSGTGGPPQ
jgi:hypothetical protein